MSLHHHLRPLLMPASVALVGASDRPASLGRVVYENLLDGEFAGELYAVNSRHRRVLGRKSVTRLTSIGKPIDLALIAVPCASVPQVLEDGAAIGLKAAVVLSAPPVDEGDARRWQRDLTATARKRHIRLLGPHAFGVMRPALGLNATMGLSRARPGRLALIAQSGAMCTALLDFAAPVGIGFSSVVALGRGVDVGFGELLDALLLDSETDSILLYVESLRDARRFLSALRAAARTKPVVVLKAGRSGETRQPHIEGIPSPMPDAVFDAAMHRAGAVRVSTYAQLFAAARLLAIGKVARGERLAIVTNGHAPGTLAADMAFDRNIPLAHLSSATTRRLSNLLPPNVARRNPINVRGDASPDRFAGAVEAVLADENVDAVLTLHVQRPLMADTAAARAVANVARPSSKPVLAAWLGALGRREVHDALEAGTIASFSSPESAVDAFSFLAAYRRNQRWLLEVAPPMQEPVAPDRVTAERIRMDAAAANRASLTAIETHRLLAAFALPVPRIEPADTLKEALAAARRVGYPVRLLVDMEPSAEIARALPGRMGLRNGRMVSRAYGELLDGVSRAQRKAYRGLLVLRDALPSASLDVAIAVHVDPVFGPVITFGNSARSALVDRERIVLLPPLNLRLAMEVIRSSRSMPRLHEEGAGRELETVARIVLQLSAMICAVPWLRSLVLDPVQIGAGQALIAGASAVIDPKRRAVPGDYRHMAIHPYPIELVAQVTLADGTPLLVRPIMPEDAGLEQAFVATLSDETRYLRFFYRLHELTPAMLARFTQVDYDREIALVAVHRGPAGPQFVAVARYIANPDLESAEYAIVVADAWQHRHIGRIVMQHLIEYARRRGLLRLEGGVLRENQGMIRFVTSLGFEVHENPEEPEQVKTILHLTAR